MKLFYSDILNNSKYSWDYLITDLKHLNFYNPYCYHSDFYTIFKNIILSLILREEIILLDSDFSQSELNTLIGSKDITQYNKPINNSELKGLENEEELLKMIKKVNSKWSVTLFTSGTTGLPKKVKHSFHSITRFVKISNKFKTNVWGFAYNPTHMAGIQVLFQALLNGNSIVRLFGLPKELIFQSIKNSQITHISATPTFYRLLLPAIGVYQEVIRITSGGEKFDDKTFFQLRKIFPNAKITNVYATTEAGTLFAAKDDIFTVKAEMQQYVKIHKNELLINKEMMGNTDINITKWYNTGDIVEIVSNNPLQIKFISRNNEMINVGGYKVNPGEIEEAIRCIEGVQDVRVFPLKNSISGNIISCEIVKNNPKLEESNIIFNLRSKFQDYKIPRIIKFVDKLLTTRTGKIKRDQI